MAEGNTVFPWTFDAVFEPIENWLIDGSNTPRQTSEIVTHQSLTLTFRVTSSELETNLRPLKPNEGKVDVLATDSGGFVALDRANGNNTFTLTPPDPRQPLRQEAEYHVRRYEEDLVSQAVGEWQVEVEFVRAENRTDSNAISETAAADEWEFIVDTGTIATSRVDAEFLGTGESGVERYELVMRLTANQAHSWETALDRQQGVRVRNIPDAPNVAVDDTSETVNTVAVTPPTGQTAVAADDYVVTGWSSRRLNDAFQEITATLAVEG